MPKGVFRKLEDVNVYACTIYDDIIKRLIKDFKYYNKKYLAQAQAQIMFDYFKQLDLSQDFLILPVPIHKLRKKERKYNHMDLTADEFSFLTGFKVNKNFIIRTKDTQKQYKLHKSERIKNIKNAFELNNKYAPDKSTPLLVIDDITSTGITLEEIIKLLKTNGYNNITALTLATPDIWN